MKKIVAILALGAVALMPLTARAEVSELRVPLGAGGFGFLPLHMMKKFELVEKEAAKAGIKLTVNYSNIGGPSVMNDALLSGSADFISAGPPAFLILWDRTKGKGDVKGVAAMSTMPMYLNTSAEHLKKLDDLKEGDKIAVTAVKVSIPAIIMQMYAKEKEGKDKTFRYDPFTVSMTHPDGVVAMLSGNKQITAHYTSPPFAQRELKDKNIRVIQTTNDVMGGAQTFTMISTTTKFHDANPKAYAAFVAGLKEAFAMIKKDKKAAAQVLLDSMGGKGWTVDELVEILDKPEIYYTTKPEGVMKYATFMNEIGSLKNKPASLDDLFFDAKNLGGGN
ncbi:MAG: ABC transporter substrate-binding protein [Pseudolabrys sp.]|nr:ABC transporter substrate-binding protein [Pseudolabrys sp.]MDP2297158.1 ABC transporter substrate-binding protein [Pseudolabrys sp.]